MKWSLFVGLSFLLLAVGLHSQQGVQGKVQLPGAVRITATGHTIELNWNASSSSGVTYSVYRSGTHNGPYLRIASGISCLTYIDLNVRRGNSYYYVVTSVDGSRESAYSNESTVTIP